MNLIMRRRLLEQRAEQLRQERLGIAGPRLTQAWAVDGDYAPQRRKPPRPASAQLEGRTASPARADDAGVARTGGASYGTMPTPLYREGPTLRNGDAQWLMPPPNHGEWFARHYEGNTRLQQVHSVYGQFLGAPRQSRHPAAPHARTTAPYGQILVGTHFPMPTSPPVAAARGARRRPATAPTKRGTPKPFAIPPAEESAMILAHANRLIMEDPLFTDRG
jgi:hypothetical protein